MGSPISAQQYMSAFLVHLAHEHGIPVEPAGDHVRIGPAGGRAAFGIENQLSFGLLLSFAADLPDGTVLYETFASMGGEPRAALDHGLELFCNVYFHVLASALWGLPASEAVEHRTLVGPDAALWDGWIGGWVSVSALGASGIDQPAGHEAWLDATVASLCRGPSPRRLKTAVSRSFEHPPTYSTTVDGEEAPALAEAFGALPWPDLGSAGFVTARQFAMVRPRAPAAFA